MATESWVLDGVALTSGNFSLMELTADPPRARAEWISSSDSESGALVRQPLHEDRVITMKLRVTAQASMDAALNQVGALRDKLREASGTGDGIPLVWTPANSTRSATFDVLHGQVMEMPISLEGQGLSWLFMARPIVTIELTCKPYYRYPEQLSSTTSGSTPVLTKELTSIPGDVPALGRLIVTDTATQNRRHVEWGLENPDTYDSGTSLLLDSDSLVTSGFAGTATTRTGAYDPGAAGNSVIRGTYYTSAYAGAQAICGTGAQSHIGSFLVKARIYSTTTNGVLRFSWQYGDGPFQPNQWAYPTVFNAFSEINLGVITIPPVLSGTQRWTGKVEISGLIGETVDIDYLMLIPVGAGYGKARASFFPKAGSVSARDEFTGTTSGNVLHARVAPAGGTWSTSGATTDFTFSDAPPGGELSPESITRATINDAGGVGRTAILGATNFTNAESYVQLQRPVAFQNLSSVMGVIARYVDGSNMLLAYIRGWENAPTPTTSDELYVDKIVAGVRTTIGRSGPLAAITPNRWYAIKLIVYTSGFYSAQLLDSPGAVVAQANGTDSSLVTGGALESGKPGLIDYQTSPTAYARYYDMFYAAIPAPEPIALYSGRTLEIRHDDAIRQDSTGVYYGRPPSYRGSRFTVLPGTSRVLVKARRYDIDVAQDENIADDLQIQVGYMPRGLVVPRA